MTTHTNGGAAKTTATKTNSSSPWSTSAMGSGELTSADQPVAEQIQALNTARERAETTHASLREFADRLADAGYATQERIARLIDRLEAQGDAERRLGQLLTSTQSQIQSLTHDVKENVDDQIKRVTGVLRDEQTAAEHLRALITESRKLSHSPTGGSTDAAAWHDLEARLTALEQCVPTSTDSAGPTATAWEQQANERLTQVLDVKIRLAMQAFEERVSAAIHRSMKSLTEEAQRQTQVIREEREQALSALRSAEGDAQAHLAEPPRQVAALLDSLDQATRRAEDISAQLDTQLASWSATQQAAATQDAGKTMGMSPEDRADLEEILAKLESVVSRGGQICKQHQQLVDKADEHRSRIETAMTAARDLLEDHTRTTTRNLERAEEARRAIDLEIRNADHKTRELGSLVQSGRECASTLAGQIREAKTHADQLLTTIQTAGSQIHNWSHHVDETLRQAEQTMTGYETTADTQQRRMAASISQLTQQEKSLETLLHTAAMHQDTIRSLLEQANTSHEHMNHEAQLLSEAMSRLDAAIERTLQVSEESSTRNLQLREAVQLADKRSQIQRQERQLDEASIKELRTQGELGRAVLADLERARGDAAETISKLQSSSTEALGAVRGVHDLLNRVDGKRADLTELEQITTDTIERVHLVSETLQQLAQRTNDLRTMLDQSLAEPRQLVSAAQAQSDQLRSVCQAVKKVSTGLSQTTLQANERIKSFNEAGQAADQKLERLQRDTMRAAEMLKHWVEEAIRAQTRLAATLSETPTIDRTHPLDVLRSLSEITNDSATASPVDTTGTSPTEIHDAVRKAGQTLQSARNRNKDISRLIEEARQKAESLVT